MKKSELIVGGWYWYRLNFSHWKVIQVKGHNGEWFDYDNLEIINPDAELVGPLIEPEY